MGRGWKSRGIREGASHSNISPSREHARLLGAAAREGILAKWVPGREGNHILRQGNKSPAGIDSWESRGLNMSETQGLKISETQGLKISESSQSLARFTNLHERTKNSVQRNLLDLWRSLRQKNGGGRLTQRMIIAGLGASVGAPVVAAAYASWGTEAAAVLNQMGAFGLGYLVNQFSDWIKSHPESDPADEDTVRAALSDVLMAIQNLAENRPNEEAVSESLRHLAVMLAEPVILGMIITIAATNGKKLLELQPDDTGGDANHDPDADDNRLLEEVLEALEEIARQPSILEATLVQVYINLQNSPS
jgi:hypothetical protein